jgi:hypothetical protein
MKIINDMRLLILYLFIFFISAILSVKYSFCNTYDPPIGIPAPEFGILETVENVYGAGYYTHYIDNTHPDATDDDNPNGTAEKPRKTIPKYFLNIEEGSVVEIHGGPYSYSTPARWTAKGTREKPVFIRGTDPENKVVIKKSTLQTGGQYLIIENLDLYRNSHITTSYSSPSHIAIRSCEVHNPIGSLCSFGTAISAVGEDIVVYDNYIHHNWRGDDIDCHGVVPGSGSRRVWVVDNHFHHHSGDAFQATHGASSNPAQYVYVGRNIMHEDRENGVDLKYVKDIVISQNILYGYQDASTSDGSAMVLGSDGMPNRPWVIFNEIYDSRNGIRNEETDSAWIIGNRIYNIQGFAIALEKKSDDLYIIGNTVYNVNMSIDQFYRDEFRLHIYNNIFSNIKNSSVHMNIQTQNVADASNMGNNLFWQEGDPVIIRWSTSNKKEYKTSSDFEGFAGGANNIIGDPKFKDPANNDFALLQNSAAIDAGILNGVYDTFFSIYGVDIKVDCEATVRPQGLDWDIGAFEYMEDTGIPYVQSDVPLKFNLFNFPNPFNPFTTIQFEVKKTSRVKLEILNIHGSVIAILADKIYNSGSYKIDWNGRDQNNRNIGSGMFFYRLTAGEHILTKKMLLIK